MNGRTALLAGVLVTALAGCATLGQSERAPLDWSAQADALAAIDAWALQGRIASRGASDIAGNLAWIQRAENFDVRVSGPLGVAAHRAVGNAQFVQVQRGDESRVLPEPERLLSEAFGWQVPLSVFRFWALGLPWPEAAAVKQFDESGQLVEMQQLQWSIRYERHRRFDGFELPSRVTMHRDDTRIRLVIDDWQRVAPVNSGWQSK